MEKLRKVRTAILRFNELLTLPLAILLFYFSPRFLRAVDPQAAVFDWGVLQVPLLSIIYLFIFTAVVWLYIRLAFPNGYKYLENIFKLQTEITAWQRAKLVFSLFLGLLFALVFMASR